MSYHETQTKSPGFIGLISGGKDSIFSIFTLVQQNYELVCLANLYSPNFREIDSYMYQSAGCEVIDHFSKILNVPLYREPIKNKAVCLDLDYKHSFDDEISHLYDLLFFIKNKHGVKFVSCGAIASVYQKSRLDYVCGELGMVALCPLWGLDESEILENMIRCNLEIIIVKTACAGLTNKFLASGIDLQFYKHMLKLKEIYGAHVCGEGGEYETLVLYCPLIYKKRMVIKKSTPLILQDDKIAPIQQLKIDEVELLDV